MRHRRRQKYANVHLSMTKCHAPETRHNHYDIAVTVNSLRNGGVGSVSGKKIVNGGNVYNFVANSDVDSDHVIRSDHARSGFVDSKDSFGMNSGEMVIDEGELSKSMEFYPDLSCLMPRTEINDSSGNIILIYPIRKEWFDDLNNITPDLTRPNQTRPVTF